jgi:WD40 repeat protein
MSLSEIFDIISSPDVEIVLKDDTKEHSMKLMKSFLAKSSDFFSKMFAMNNQPSYTCFVENVDIMKEIILSMYGFKERIFIGSTQDYVFKKFVCLDYLNLKADIDQFYGINGDDFHQGLKQISADRDNLVGIPNVLENAILELHYVVAASAMDKIYIWSLVTRRLIKIIDTKIHPKFEQSSCCYPDDEKKKCLIHSTSNVRHGNIQSMCSSFDGKYLVSADNDGYIRIWNGDSYEHIRTITLDNKSISKLELSLDGSKLLIANCDRVSLIDFDSGKFIRNIHQKYIATAGQNATFSNNNKLIAASESYHNWNHHNVVLIWNADSELEEYLSMLYIGNGTRYANYSRVINILFSPDDSKIACACDNGDVQVWDITDVKNPQRLYTIGVTRYQPWGHRFECARFSPDGKYLITAGSLPTIFWNVETGRSVKLFKESGDVQSINFSRDGKYLVLGKRDEITAYDLETDEEINTFEKPLDNMHYVTNIMLCH